MSKVGPEGRSYRGISGDDLRRLAQIARKDREMLFAERPGWAIFAQRVICVALCQGAALHMLNGEVGINDFDVYTFYAAYPAKRWCSRRIKCYDFGDPKFGQSLDRPDFVGRRVDCIGRDVDVRDGEGPVEALQRYLREGKTETARLLAEKAVVLLEPECGRVVWPATGETHVG